MGGRYPLLDRDQVEAVLKAAGFRPARTKGSHTHWEGVVGGERRLVTVDHLNSKKEKYGPLLGKMIRQSGLTKKEFYAYLR
ncbi:MAG: type II toxin-antitoxin system HicA family toxin [Deltaproteobacteria bacterium]|nr:type II toxin-antitoxin system HicA family toxin [Deltaproteobacteria bacterium]